MQGLIFESVLTWDLGRTLYGDSPALPVFLENNRLGI